MSFLSIWSLKKLLLLQRTNNVLYLFLHIVVTIGFLSNSYTGSESDGYATLTVGVTNGQLQRDFIVTLTNEDQNVTNTATGMMNYHSVMFNTPVGKGYEMV